MTRTVGLLREGKTEGTLEERGGLGGIRKRLGLRGVGREGPAATGWRRMGRREAEDVGIVVGKMKFIAVAEALSLARRRVCWGPRGSSLLLESAMEMLRNLE